MFFQKPTSTHLWTALFLSTLVLTGCRFKPVKVSFILTNDIHGHLEADTTKDGVKIGGMGMLGSIVNEIRNKEEYQKNDSALFILDAGDQFQGTLLSNHNEGEAIFDSMDRIGYDAVVPGNHDYDFGPAGWLQDKVISGETSDNPFEVIEGLSKRVRFPLISANTYFKNSIHFKKSDASVELDSQCRLKNATSADSLDFSRAERPSFLKPYVIVKKAGIKVALIGLDNHSTATSTTIENVTSLCFRDEVETYLELRKELEGKADLFVLIMHNGNHSNSNEASEIVRKINQEYKNGIHLAVAGHTHFIHDDQIDGIRVIQNGANNNHYGRVDLIYDPFHKTVVNEVTKSKAGIPISGSFCEETVNPFCDEIQLPLEPNIDLELIIQDAKKRVEAIAKKKLGTAIDRIYRNRTDESPLSNALTDALKNAGQTQIALMNTGGIRSDLDAGEITYEKIFEVLPFSNQAVTINSMNWSTLKKTLQKSIQTCGKYGALMQSGLRIRFARNCTKDSDLDPSAKLVRVELETGKVLFDEISGFEIALTDTFSVTTLDFLAAGGSGYSDLTEASVSTTLGIAREIIANAMAKNLPVLTKRTDGRFVNIAKKP